MTKVLDGLLSDPALSASLGSAGQRRAAMFDWPIVATRYRSLYADVLGPRGPQGGT
jgi:glycosyltransferase involved in cell wall biosynthesis